jgi:hypothetical protein
LHLSPGRPARYMSPIAIVACLIPSFGNVERIGKPGTRVPKAFFHRDTLRVPLVGFDQVRYRS